MPQAEPAASRYWAGQLFDEQLRALLDAALALAWAWAGPTRRAETSAVLRGS